MPRAALPEVRQVIAAIAFSRSRDSRNVEASPWELDAARGKPPKP
jgi:hypothetical protein